MTKKILWLDNDPGYLQPYLYVLREEGYDVTVAPTLSRADYLLRTRRYDLLLLDVMIPIVDVEEEARYPPSQTENSLKTGLVFYKVNRELLDRSSTQVLVMTVRMDSSIREEFVALGLPPHCFATKLELAYVDDFLNRIKSMI